MTENNHPCHPPLDTLVGAPRGAKTASQRTAFAHAYCPTFLPGSGPVFASRRAFRFVFLPAFCFALAFRCHSERAQRRGTSLRPCRPPHEQPASRVSAGSILRFRFLAGRTFQVRHKSPAQSAFLSRCLSREFSFLNSRPNREAGMNLQKGAGCRMMSYFAPSGARRCTTRDQSEIEPGGN